jgi:Spy/CpxP family protein refolding chaperone
VYTASKKVMGGNLRMRRKIAIGTLSLMVSLAAAIVIWAQDPAPQAADPGQGQHQMGGGGQHQWGGGGQQGQWGGGARRFAGGGPGQFRRAGGPGQRGMGMRRGGGRGFGGGGGMLRMAENPMVRKALGLTDEQVGKLHKIGVDAEKSAVQTRAQMEMNRIELRELMRGENPDQSAIMAKIDEGSALRAKMEKARVQTMFDAKAVLTPEQRAKVKTFMENRGAGGMGRGGMMQRQGGPGRPQGQQGGPGGAPAGPTPKPQEPPVQ